jgi:hypothetical protein
MTRFSTLILLFALFSFPILGGEQNLSTVQGWSFASSDLVFHPLRANTLEPRVGIREVSDHSSLRLDIGNSIDVLQYTGEQLYTVGVDFFTYTKLRSEQNFHFPVDAVDYLFGFNAGMKDTLRQGILSGRVRLSHISAHMVDGHYDNFAHIWKDNRNPIVYSREFLDAVCAFEPEALDGQLRIYAGGIYIYHIDPKMLGRTSWYAGAEFVLPVLRRLSCYAAYQPTLLNIGGWSVRHEVEAGVHVGILHGRGANIFLAYLSGKSIQGEYYSVTEKTLSLGLSFDL